MVVTPVKTDRLQHWLAPLPHDHSHFLLEGFSKGFRIHFDGPQIVNPPHNHPSIFHYHAQVQDMLSKELALGRISGPFQHPPYDHLVLSPLGIVPKKDPGKFRLIHDLSYPRLSSVNSFISDEFATVQYETLDTVVNLVQSFGKGALMGKLDIKEAFRIIPVHPDDRHLLGFMFDGQFYIDNCLPMGCRSSCQIFEAFSSALQSVSCTHSTQTAISHILDDFIFIGPPNSPNTLAHLQSFSDMCLDCGVPIKHSKTVLPSTTIQAHGIEVDSVKMQLRLPQDKLLHAKQILHQFSTKRKVTLRQLQSLLGLLNFACKAIKPGRPFLRRLIDLTKGVTNPNFSIRLNKQARADIAAWLVFLQSFNGTSMFLSTHWLSSDTLNLYSDSAGAFGFAAVLGSHWFAGAWPSPLQRLHITFKELFPIVLSLEIWGHFLSNSKVIFNSDNLAVVHIINKQTSTESYIMPLVRRLVVAALTHNILFKAQHIPGFTNVVADRLSRFQFQEARTVAPWLDQRQTEIPQQLLLVNWN